MFRSWKLANQAWKSATTPPLPPDSYLKKVEVKPARKEIKGRRREETGVSPDPSSVGSRPLLLLKILPIQLLFSSFCVLALIKASTLVIASGSSYNPALVGVGPYVVGEW